MRNYEKGLQVHLARRLGKIREREKGKEREKKSGGEKRRERVITEWEEERTEEKSLHPSGSRDLENLVSFPQDEDNDLDLAPLNIFPA